MSLQSLSRRWRALDSMPALLDLILYAPGESIDNKEDGM